MERAIAAAQVGQQVAQSVQFDWTINAGNLIVAVVTLISAIGFILALSINQKALQAKVHELRIEVASLGKAVMVMGVYEERFLGLNRRFDRVEEDIAMLRKGEGMIFPISRYRPPEG